MPKKSKTQNIFRNFAVQFVIATLLFGLSAYLASKGTMTAVEAKIFRSVYGWPASLRPLFLVITQFGNVYLLLILSILYLLKQHYHVVIRLLMSGLMAYLLAGVAKDLVGRPRPAQLLLNITVRDFYVRGPGFPSGHVAMATAIGLTLMRYLPRKYRWLMPVMILLVALSRLYLGVHAPLDLVGGFALGWIATLLFRNVKLLDIRRRQPLESKKNLKN